MTTSPMASLPPRFVRIKIVPQPDGSTKKIPVSDSGSPIDAHNPVTWRPRELCGPQCGFVLNGDGYFLLDMDQCRDDAGVWSPQAMAILAMFPTAAREVSTSGRGLHVMGRCDVAALADRRNKWDGWLEFYTSGRIVTFGPGGWAGDPESDCTAALLRLVPQRPAGPDLGATAGQSPATDEQVLARMLKAAGAGARFGGGATPADLWLANADVLAQSYPSSTPGQAYDASTADAALMAHLAFWTHRDPLQMDRLFRQSGLMRAKYEEREDYRNSTISGAISVTRNVADWRTPAEKESAVLVPGSPEAAVRGYLTVSDQLQHFAGCVYVTAAHAVLTPTGELLTPERFNARYGGHEFAMQADGAKPTRRAFECFTESRAHRFPRVATTVWDPRKRFGEVVADDDGPAVNIYKPANVESVPGDVSLFLGHLAKLLPVESDRAILLQYMACVVQKPGHKVRWAPVVQGVEGNGKTFLVDCLRAAIGRKFVHTAKSEELSEKFNDFLEHNLMIAVEEVDTRDRREVMNILKPLITNVDFEVRAMQRAKRKGRCFANFFFCCNPRDAIAKTRNDRRYAIFYTAQQNAEDLERDGMTDAYFTTLYDWAHGGGFAHVTYWLMHHAIGTIATRTPDTSSTQAAIEESRTPAEAAICDAIEDCRPGFIGGWLSSWAAAAVVERATGRVPHRASLGIAIRNLGYKKIMQASHVVMAEGGTRPRIYALTDRAPEIDHYLMAQGYSHAPVHLVHGA